MTGEDRRSRGDRQMQGIFGERGFLALEKGLEALALRHRVLADNVANANTPGFKRADVSFAAELAAYLDRQAGRRGAPLRGGSGGAAGAGQAEFRPRIWRMVTTSQRLDGNNVDIEAEMARLAENALLYEAAVRQLSAKLNCLRLAITEGRR